MVRKFLLTSAVIFWPKGSCIQVAVAVMVSMFFLGFHLYHMPYDSRADNWFQVVALSGLLLVYFMGLLIKVQPNLEQRYAFDSLLQLISGAVAAIVLVVPIIHKARLRVRTMQIVSRSRSMIELPTLSSEHVSGGMGGDYALMDDEDDNTKDSAQTQPQQLLDLQEQLQREQAQRAAMKEHFQREQQERVAEQEVYS